jgi:ubiquinone/menaquinone biosynthesis C-methylase UbiE
MKLPFFRREDRYALSVSMAGVKLGDHVLQVGCGDGGLLAALAAKTGLTGRACGVDEDAAAVAQAQAAAARAGVLIETETAPYTMLPYGGSDFDLVVLRDVLASMRPEQRVLSLREILRVLRPGGRCLVIEPAPRGGLGALVGPKPRDRYYASTGGAEGALRAEGFKATRRLAEREGLAFVEGVKARLTAG